MSTHDKLVEALEERLQATRKYSIWKEANFPNCQIDLMAFHTLRPRHVHVLLFEMKSNYSEKSQRKARHQLDHAIKCFKIPGVYAFEVYGPAENYTVRRYKHAIRNIS